MPTVVAVLQASAERVAVDSLLLYLPSATVDVEVAYLGCLHH